MTFTTTRQQRRALEAENAKWPERLRQVPRADWPQSVVPPSRQPTEVWRSRDFLVQVFAETAEGIERLSILRTQHDGSRFIDGIGWDDLQRLKNQCGRGDRDAVEIYPADRDVVNVANMRHLFVFVTPFPLAWRK
jgi:hypothetical protein